MLLLSEDEYEDEDEEAEGFLRFRLIKGSREPEEQSKLWDGLEGSRCGGGHLSDGLGQPMWEG